MKKLLAMLLALVTVLSLCACGDNHNATDDYDDSDENANTPTEVTTDQVQFDEPDSSEGPTFEESTILDQYSQIVYSLDYHREDGMIRAAFHWDDLEADLRDSEAVACYYNLLQQMDLTVIDKYKDTEYLSRFEYQGVPINWDYETVLAGFSTREGALLEWVRENKGKDGQTENEEHSFRAYDQKGNLINEGTLCNGDHELRGLVLLDQEQLRAGYLEDVDPFGRREYVYDDAGNLEMINYLNVNDEVVYAETPAYDENGKKTSVTFHGLTKTPIQFIYTYDDTDRLSNIHWESGDYVDDFEYCYDATGNIAMIVHKTEANGDFWSRKTYEYDYDAQGKVTSYLLFISSAPFGDSTAQYQVTYDQQGRIDTIRAETSDTSSVLKGQYGTYYHYTPAN